MQRVIKSFTKRERKLKRTQQYIFDNFLPIYGINSPQDFIFSDQQKKITLEIGFGNGENLFFLARKYPERFFVGIEVYKQGIVHLLSLLEKYLIQNVKIYYNEATHILQFIPDEILHEILIFFLTRGKKNDIIKDA